MDPNPTLFNNPNLQQVHDVSSACLDTD
jgi:hypothetical protein